MMRSEFLDWIIWVLFQEWEGNDSVAESACDNPQAKNRATKKVHELFYWSEKKYKDFGLLVLSQDPGMDLLAFT